MFAFFLFAVFFTKAFGDCPPNATKWNSECYMFYLNSSGFADAELNCNQNGGHLASIHDGFTNALLPQEAYKRLHESTETDFWIGATNLMSGNSWNWTDGSLFDFKDWKTGEPQNTTGANCAVQSLND
uniref:C-type lectin domain-containing protein n=1 Tax=Panagrolaimus davidi TaxID=227884 RepID=A0A914PT50_9BILA